jgi:two-component system nitrate/nitrite response regulator NarL
LLTARQMLVLRLMAQGKGNKEIARTLSLSEITVKTHVTAILKKLRVENRVQAALAARDLLQDLDAT